MRVTTEVAKGSLFFHFHDDDACHNRRTALPCGPTIVLAGWNRGVHDIYVWFSGVSTGRFMSRACLCVGVIPQLGGYVVGAFTYTYRVAFGESISHCVCVLERKRMRGLRLRDRLVDSFPTAPNLIPFGLHNASRGNRPDLPNGKLHPSSLALLPAVHRLSKLQPSRKPSQSRRLRGSQALAACSLIAHCRAVD